MNTRRKMDLRNFFSSVKKKHHLANLSVQNFRDEEREAAEAVKKDMRRAQIEEQREADRLAARKRRDDARNAEIAEDKRTDEERVQDEIDGLAEEIPDLRPAQKKTKLWQSRNWVSHLMRRNWVLPLIWKAAMRVIKYR